MAVLLEAVLMMAVFGVVMCLLCWDMGYGGVSRVGVGDVGVDGSGVFQYVRIWQMVMLVESVLVLVM